MAAYKDNVYRNMIAHRYGIFLVVNEYNFWTPFILKNFNALEMPKTLLSVYTERLVKNNKYDGYYNNIKGWINPEDLNWLIETSSKMKTIVEVGSWKGRSSHAILTGCKNGKVYLVDHFKGNNDENIKKGQPHWEATEKDISIELLENLKMFKNFELLKMDSFSASKLFEPKSIDMVFLDAGHTHLELKRDLNFWEPICKQIICGHDFTYEQIKYTVYEKFGKEKVITPSGSIWMVNL